MHRQGSVILFYIYLISCTLYSCSSKIHPGSNEDVFLEQLRVLNLRLARELQHDHNMADSGALWCPACGLYHTRAAEAMYPLAYEGRIDEKPERISEAIALGNWLISQQEEDGSWKETPEEWTGTTTDQLLMMGLSWPLLNAELGEAEQKAWISSMRAAGDFLLEKMDPGFASINYVATTSATMAVLNRVLPDSAFARKARQMAWMVMARMDPDGFITGEGGRVDGIKYGVDLGYNLEMSLWGLGLYARISNDTAVWKQLLQSAGRHLHFIKPDGSMDASWGIRSNKWTGYGSATSDGALALFSMLSTEDRVYATAARRNLEYMKNCMLDGLLAYGPIHDTAVYGLPCIYPSFAKAKNLALAHQLAVEGQTAPDPQAASDARKATNAHPAGAFPPLPSDKNGIEYFPTLEVATMRSANFHATVTAYGYKDPRGTSRKYMFRPTGGALSNLWMKGYGFVQAGSQTEYHRWEPMSFPEMPQTSPLTPRILSARKGVEYTNLFEFDALMEVRKARKPGLVVHGYLKNREQREGGVGYSIAYSLEERELRKSYHLRYLETPETIKIIEPLVLYPGSSLEQTGPGQWLLRAEGLKLKISVEQGGMGRKSVPELSAGQSPESYISCFPALKAFPLELRLQPAPGDIEDRVEIKFQIIDE